MTGSIVGNPGTTSSDAGILSHSGEAPEAKLYFQDIGAQSGGLSGLDNVGDLGEGLFQRAFDAGARIHSNSWVSVSSRTAHASDAHTRLRERPGARLASQ